MPPDKLKRKKNNKNKRKNKNQRDPSKNTNNPKELDNEKFKTFEYDTNDENIHKDGVIINEKPDSIVQSCEVIHNSELLSENYSPGIITHSSLLPTNDEAVSTDGLNTQNFPTYSVEDPEQRIAQTKPKIGPTIKSKSLDSDDVPKIVDISNEITNQQEDEKSVALIDCSNIIVSEVESDVEWEKTDEIIESENLNIKEHATGKLIITTIPLETAQCDQTQSLTFKEEASLRNYLNTLNLSTQPEDVCSIEVKDEVEHSINREVKHRLRKKASADEFFVQRLGPPRVLDVIDEEGSGDSSATSRRQSYLNEKKSDNEDLEDDVFEDNNKLNDKFDTIVTVRNRNKYFGRLVPQQCVLVGAKLKEPEVTEARGDWTVQTIEKMTGAEVVYLTDSSSSTSSIHEVGDDTDDGIETDSSVRMITPTIEVTDTENFLKKTFLSSSNNRDDQAPLESKVKLVEHEDNVENKITIDMETDEKKESFDSVSHEIVVLSTEDIKTELYVKDLNEHEEMKIDQTKDTIISEDINIENKPQKQTNEYDLELKVIKCELNDAINNLLKEVSSDSEINNETFTRQDSSSSIGSSQCTAKYNPNSSSLNDISNVTQEDNFENNPKKIDEFTSRSSHVKDIIDCVSGVSVQSSKNEINTNNPLTLKDCCLEKIASLPYGDKILEELASVSERLQNMNISKKKTSEENIKQSVNKISHIYSNDSTEKGTHKSNKMTVPPPLKPRRSSLIKKVSDEEPRSKLPSKIEQVQICLSPSQKMLMEKTNTTISNYEINNRIEVHKKYAEHKGHSECKEVEKGYMSDNSPVLPFKSQTGSRLLALICDPKLTSNVQSLNSRCNSSFDQMKNNCSGTEKNKYSTFQDFSSYFKPIPPPRPRKISSSFYESDENSDFTDNSFRSIKKENKFFHYSTGNLNKEIENDVSTIQNMHRFYTNVRDQLNNVNSPRRPSLPKDICDQQMEYIRQKEKEVDEEIQRLEEKSRNSYLTQQRKGPRAPLISEKEVVNDTIKDANNFSISRKKDILITSPCIDTDMKRGKENISSLFSNSQEEIQREQMYSEYINQMAAREERKQHKIIKITNTPTKQSTISKSLSDLEFLESKINNPLEKEFIRKARERWDKLGIRDPETEDEKEVPKNTYKEPKVIEHKIKVITGDEEKELQKLPTHLQEFVKFTAKEKEHRSEEPETVMITPTFKARSTSPAVWRPGAPTPPPAPALPGACSPGAPPPPPPPPIWSPSSAGPSPQATRKTFRPVNFEETPPSRRKFPNSEQNGCTSGSESEGRLRTSQSAPVTGLNSLSINTSRLPRAQNPTVTLLQKAREGQIPRGSSYLQQERDSARLPRDRPSPPKGDIVHALRKEYASEGEAERSYHERGTRKMADASRKVEGIGPTTKDGMPVALRSEVKDPSRWYKKMYDTIHKNKYDDDYVTIRYKSRRGQPPERVSSNKSQYAYFDPRSGYLSEPEGGLSRLGSSTWSDAYDSDVTTGHRRRTASVQEDSRMSEVSSSYLSNNKYSTLASAKASQELYKNQPGRIEDYVPGKSSVVDKEAKQWWDEVMDIFDGQNISSTTSLPQASPKEKKDITSAILSKSNMARALKESGYESDSTLIFRRREDTEAPLSPAERRAAYRDLQAGGEPPLRGFRSPAPPRQESPRRYVESDVNIHYKCPVRHDPLPLVPERELARQQAEHMKRLYREQRRNKYLQELQDMQNRRHQDNFTPSQKTVVPLNRYDEADKVIARALYSFNGQTNRELSFRKGDLIHVRRQIDANWYEGEVHGRIGLFPYNYVEIQKGDVVQPPKKPALVEGRARAKFDFTAQTNLELPLKKGEVVVLTRRIDQNWWEGRNGVKTGIFPDSYVTVLQEPSQNKPELQPIQNSDKPVASPAAHGLVNGSARRSMGSHCYTPQPNSPALANAPPATQPLPGYAAKPGKGTLTPSERGYGPPTGQGVDLNNTEPLYVDTNAEAIPYRAMYKYRPQNPDELELNEGDTVYVLEKCDDGWYVGSSQRSGRFGTFPGNYVERI